MFSDKTQNQPYSKKVFRILNGSNHVGFP